MYTYMLYTHLFEGFLKTEVPLAIIHFRLGISTINHFGDPPCMETLIWDRRMGLFNADWGDWMSPAQSL